ncbi:MAG TPA: pseudouridine synthase [Gammaproteobacteria bacterium]|nr:pseudouridine synthase [Gammaproteobacteria bacterium]
MRLNKYLGDSGRCSRREADALIAAGRVTVNGVRAGSGAQIGEGDEVCIDGEALAARERPERRTRFYLALNKPVGVTCTTDRRVEGNIVDFVDHPERIFPIGRLDRNSEGLILLTSDGDIVNRILRAENKLEKEYIVVVDKAITPAFLAGMARGVRIHRTTTLPCRLYRINRYTFGIILVQGLNRQIRLMCEAFDYHVRQLCRIRIGNLRLDHLKPGRWRKLAPGEVQGLLAAAGHAATPSPARAPRRAAAGKRKPD